MSVFTQYISLIQQAFHDSGVARPTAEQVENIFTRIDVRVQEARRLAPPPTPVTIPPEIVKAVETAVVEAVDSALSEKV